MHERSPISVKVEPCSTSHLSSALFILPMFYLRDSNLRALTCAAKNALVEIKPKGKVTAVNVWNKQIYSGNQLWLALAQVELPRMLVPACSLLQLKSRKS